MRKKILIYSILFFVFTSFDSLPIQGQSTEEIVEKMIEAQGGRKALEEIKDTTLIGFVEMVRMGLGGSLITYQKEPNLLRTDTHVRGTTITQAYDGQTAWMVNPITGDEEEMPEPMAKDFSRSSLGNDALLNPEKYGIVYSLEGRKTISGKDYYIISQIYPDEYQAIMFIDPETYLIHKTITQAVDGAGNESSVETFFSDYQKVQHITLAHSIVTFQDGKEFMKMEITEVKFNTGLEDAFFQMKKNSFPCEPSFQFNQ